MSWKDELITDPDAAFDFLKRQIAAQTNIADFRLTRHPDEPDPSTYQIFSAREIPKGIISSDLFFMGIGKDSGASDSTIIRIGNFRVRDDLQRNEIGPIGVKAVLGLVYAHSGDELLIGPVTDKGKSFWPYLGAVPPAAPVNFRERILHSVEPYKTFITSNELRQINGIADIAAGSPYAAWRLVARMPFQNRSLGNALKAEILANPDGTHADYNLLILPGEATTGKILKEQQGVLPPFRPLDSAGRHSSVAAALAETPRLANSLKL